MAEEEKIVVPADKPEISKKVKVDLEVDTSVKDLGPKSFTLVSTSKSTCIFCLGSTTLLTCFTIFEILPFHSLVFFFNKSHQ